ncbi:MAG: MFS transporter [Rhodospirillales bacterium]
MNAAFGAVTPLLSGMAVLVLGVGALNVLIPLSMQADGLPDWATGLVMASFFAGAVAGPFFAQRMIAKIGHVRTFATFVSLASAATLAHPFMDHPAVWAVLRFVYGFLMVGIYVVVESWLNERATNETRGRVLSVYVVVIFLFQGLGQFLVNIPDPTGIATYALISVLISVAAIPVLAARVPEPSIAAINPMNFRRMFAASPLGVIGIFASGIIFGSLIGLGPVYARGLGLSTVETSAFMSAAFIGGLVLQWPAGSISDRIGRRPVLLVLGGLVVAGSAVLGLLPVGVAAWVPITLAALFGAVYFVIYPLCIAITNDRLPPEDLVPASGGLLITNNIGNTTGPIIAGAVIGSIGGGGVFLVCGIAGLVIVATAVWRATQRPALIPEERDAFQPVPGLSPVASELDPRGETPG